MSDVTIPAGRLKSIVRELYERREYNECWGFFADGDTATVFDEPGDCGNWDNCPETCPLKALGLLAGFVPQADGGTDKQPCPESQSAEEE